MKKSLWNQRGVRNKLVVISINYPILVKNVKFGKKVLVTHRSVV